MRIDALIRHEVMAIEPEKKIVAVKDHLSGKGFTKDYDELLIATGARPLRPDLPGVEAKNIYDANTLTTGSILKEAIEKDKPNQAVIVGAGYIGLEIAEALHLQGIKTTIIQRGEYPMPMLDRELGKRLAATLRKSGVKLRLNESLTGFTVQNGLVKEVTTDKGSIATTFVILALGVTPESRLAEDCGIALGPRKAIAVNQLQKTSAPHIWAAGDCAQSLHLVSGQPVHVAMGTVANKQGRVAGMNISGQQTAFPGIVGTAITKYLDTEISKTGLGEKELNELGIDFITVTVEGNTKPRYYPGSAAMTVRLHAEKGSGRLLGVQILGGPESAKRIDTAATALHAGFDLDQLLYLDLAYAPPFSGVWEPLVIAARLALKKL